MLDKIVFQTLNISEHNQEQLTFENLRHQCSIGQNTSTGGGRNKEYSYKHGVKTPLGIIEENQWYRLMEQLIKRSGEEWLLDALIQWEKEHNHTRSSPADIREKALRLHSFRLFDSPQWVCFIPFNRRFRPDALEGAHIVTVINECCGVPGGVTQEQIDRACADTVRCPHCGRWSRFTICSANGTEE